MRFFIRPRQLGLFCALIWPALFAPAKAADAPVTVSLSVLDSLSVTRIDDLDFGTILSGAATGRVEIDEKDGDCSDQGGATLVGSGCHAAVFRISGQPDTRVRIDLSSAAITLSRIGGGASMTMDRLRVRGGGNERLEADGTFTFLVGGRLQIGANQQPGMYEATFDVTVELR